MSLQKILNFLPSSAVAMRNCSIAGALSGGILFGSYAVTYNHVPDPRLHDDWKYNRFDDTVKSAIVGTACGGIFGAVCGATYPISIPVGVIYGAKCIKDSRNSNE